MQYDGWIEELKACAEYLKHNADRIVQPGQHEQKITITITITHEAAAMVEVKKDILPKEVMESLRLAERSNFVNENCKYFSRDGSRQCWECEKPRCKKYWCYHDTAPET